jgi:osmoprotectant transport system permease protein
VKHFVWATIAACLVATSSMCQAAEIRVNSKEDTETTLLAHVIALLLEHEGMQVDDKHFRLGGSPVVWKALCAGEIDMYVDYTGTLSLQIFAGQGIHNQAELRRELARHGIGMTRPLGFANNYAIGMRRSRAEELGIRRVSDLKKYPNLVLGFSNEFVNREDGWRGLRQHYGLPQADVRGMDHRIAYEALAASAIDATELYTTDAEIRRFDLTGLEDDANFFPLYEAVILYRLEFEKSHPAAVAACRKLEGRLSQSTMIEMNDRALAKEPMATIAADFIEREFGERPQVQIESSARRLWRLTVAHLTLVGISLGAAILIGLPLGVVSARRPRLGQVLIGGAGVIQTIPALALLVFMIPLLKTGALPAIVALFLYSLLPIINNTATGLQSIPRPLLESADALGLSHAARLWLIELPMASPSILTGIRTSAVINIGTATLGALIGAGGYGQPIQTGLQMMDHREILFGAVPAALMALAAQGLLTWSERLLVPRGLRLRQQH